MSQTKKAKLQERELELACQELELKVWKLQKERGVIENSPVAAGHFTLLGVVNDAKVHELMDNMTVWSNLHPGAPITLEINSEGGVVVSGNAFFDFLMRLRAKGHKLTTVAIGLCASMGAVILQAGEERIASPKAWLMLHEVQGVVEGATSEMKNAIKFNERLQSQVLDTLAARSNWTRASLRNKWKDDIWLDAEDALKAGFVDRIEG